MASPGRFHCEFVEQRRKLHAWAELTDGWAERPGGNSFFAECRGEGSPELFGRRITLRAWATGPVPLLSTEKETLVWAGCGCEIFVAGGTLHCVMRVRSEDDLPNRDFFGDWTPQRPDGLQREWSVYVPLPRPDVTFRVLLVLAAADRLVKKVTRVPTEHACFVRGGLPSLGKR